MPTPPEGPTSDVEDAGAESSGGREDAAAGDGTPHSGAPRWTEEDWKRWNAGTWSWHQGRDLMRGIQPMSTGPTPLGGQVPPSQNHGANHGGTPGPSANMVVRGMSQ